MAVVMRAACAARFRRIGVAEEPNNEKEKKPNQRMMSETRQDGTLETDWRRRLGKRGAKRRVRGPERTVGSLIRHGRGGHLMSIILRS